MSAWPESAVAEVAVLNEALENAEAEVKRLKTWDGLMETLDRHYPADVFDGSSGDPGARVVVLLREVERLREGGEVLDGVIIWLSDENQALQAEVDRLRVCVEQLELVLRHVSMLRAERDALQTEVERRKTIHREDTSKLIAAGTRAEQLEQAMREAEWMVEGHVTGPDTYAIWQRYRSALHPDQQEQG